MSTEKQSAPDAGAGTSMSGESNSASEPVRDDVIVRLAQICQGLLGVGPIGPDQSYFDLGGDSIFAVQLLTQIEQEFKIQLPLASLFDAPTIRELAQALSRAKS